MAQDENAIPTDGNSKRRSVDLLPRYFRTTANKKFLSATLDQLVQPGSIEKIDGFIGRRDAKAFKASDNYVADVSQDRQNYQLEPVATISDDLGNTTYYGDYRDLINSAKIRGADNINHSNYNSQEYYAWDPHISWDKFVNFREYYWLPSGPDEIPVFGNARNITSTFNVKKQDNVDNNSYIFSEDNIVNNPTITLYRGQTYNFDIDAVDMPFSIRTSTDIDDDTNLYTIGVDKQKVEKGTITFEVDLEAPEVLYYTNGNDVEASGLIIIKDIRDNSELDVGENILGKKTYTMQNGYELTNGMKVKFYGKITPSQYGEGNWYVEGVGDSIKLISEDDLVITADYLDDVSTEFDNQGFSALPFDDATSYATVKDYIVINRSAKDGNQWSRYNKWTHKSVIENIAKINNVPVVLNQQFRATRPIIEFEAGLKLYNFGTKTKASVDLVDTVTKDVFSDIEGQVGYFVDGVELVSGMRVLFTADPDSFVSGKIYEVRFINQNGTLQIALKETTDATPLENETVLVKSGTNFKGKIFYYNGTTWKQTQDKIKVNQQPLFDLYNDAGTELSALESSTFRGNKVFSYKVGTGANDTELGFPLSYRTIENSGDIVFDFNLLSDSYQYDELADVFTVSTDTALLRKYTDRTTFTSVSAWTKAPYKSKQYVADQFVVAERTNNFIVDVYKNSGDLNDLEIRAYVNGVRKRETVDYVINRVNGYAYVQFNKDLVKDDKLVLKTSSSAKKLNGLGYYEYPINFEKNPMNENVTTFTLGEVLDHVDSIVDNIEGFKGVYPGVSNLRDLGHASQYGLKFVQHSGPINLALYNLTDKDYDAIEAIKYSGFEYIKFKREFLRTANELGFEGTDKIHVDKVLDKLMENKTNKDAFYFSDMMAYSGDTKVRHIIEDESQTIFSLVRGVDYNTLSEKAVYAYLNEKQLLLGKDYSVSADGFLTLLNPPTGGDVLDVYEYVTTDGCWVPPTPTKLGLYPKYTPEIILDDTYLKTPTDVTGPWKVYGIDETTTKSYKGKLGWFYPIYTDETSAQQADIVAGGTGEAHTHTFVGTNKLFWMPNSSMGHATNDSQTFIEYPNARPMIQGHDGSLWRCFGDFRDTLLLDLEKRIYNNLKQQYNENILDIIDYVPGQNRNTGFTRKQISKTMIAEFNSWLETVATPDYVSNTYYKPGDGFTYNYSSAGDPYGNALSGFWRSIYKDFYNTDRPHSHPWEILGFKEKPDWFDDTYGPAPYTANNLILWEDLSKGIVKGTKGSKITYRNKFKNEDIFNYIPVDVEGNLLPPSATGFAVGNIPTTNDNEFAFGDEGPVETAWRRSSHYPFSLMISWALNQPAQFFGLAFDISRIKRNSANQLVYEDTSKRIELNQLQFPNSATDAQRIFTAGIVNYIQGYLADNDTLRFSEYKNNLQSIENKLGSKIGGFTQKSKFRLILDSRTPSNEGNVFVPDENYKIHLTKSIPLDVYSYSGVIIEIVPQGYVVKGYDRDNPVFKYFPVRRKNSDPLINVGGVSENFLTWTEGKTYEAGQIVELQDNYYRVKISHTAGDGFNQDNFQKLAELPEEGGASAYISDNFDVELAEMPYGTLLRDKQDVVDLLIGYQEYLKRVGFSFDKFNQEIEEIENWRLSAKEFLFWTTQNWDSGTILTLSPSARQIEFTKPYTVVDDIYDNFYAYSLLKADGKRLLADFATTERDNTNDFGIFVRNTNDGIYHLKIPVVQYEHAVIIDNKTVFGDVVYNRAQGYRQERIKIKGYRSDEWNGSYNIPGFIFDDAKVVEWTSWTDYSIGDLVKYKQYFYVAQKNVPGSQLFNDYDFVRLNDKPEQRMLPNFDYKARQFADFYDLESDNFDIEQQKLAQHLTGYQKRKYLENIINDDVSQFKFYQGAIQDKGTRNVLTKLFDKLGSANKDSLEFYEEWAVRVGRYGATKGDEQFDLSLDESKYRQEPQLVQLVDFIDPKDTSLIYKVDRNGVYVKPDNYDHKPLPTKYFNDDNSFTKTAGYVNPVDITTQLVSYNDILQQSLYPAGSYIWTAEDKSGQTWGVYKTVSTDYRITEVTASQENKFKITIDKIADYTKGDIIGINDISSDTDGYYKIDSVNLAVITLESVEGEDVEATEPDAVVNGYITEFKPARLKTLQLANDSIKKDPDNIFSLTGSNSATNTIWVDDDDTGKWIVLKNKQVFELKPNIVNTNAGLLDSTEKDFGNAFSVSKDNNRIAISAPKDLNGSVYVYQRPSDNTDFGFLQQIDEQLFLFDSNGGFGQSVAMSPDGKYLAVGSPHASNTKSRLKGDYKNNIAYTTGDIVIYSDQLWKAARNVEADAIQTYQSHASNQQAKSNDYISDTQSYPEIEYMVRGDYTLGKTEATDHILIRAEKEQFEGTKPGDILSLKWNKYTTTTAGGREPFNGDPILTESLINGQHTIADKVQYIVHIQSALSIPDAGTEITTETARATLTYRKVNDENEMTVYIKDVNGSFQASGSIFANGILVGEYEQVLQITDDYHTGWWKVNVGSAFNTEELSDTTANLVVRNITLETQTVNDPFFSNILDTKQIQDVTKPTKVSEIGIFSHTQGQSDIEVLDSKWWVRTPLAHGNSISPGDKTRIWLNDIRVNGLVQNPSAIGLDSTYINTTEHTVADVWNGYVEVRLTNFDLQGNPFIPNIGDTLTDTATGSTAEIAYIERAFATAKIYLKNRNGTWAVGSDFGENSNATFVEIDPNLGPATRTIGPINSAHMENSISGPIIVIDTGTNIPVVVGGANYLRDLEYWIYSSSLIQGITDSANPPSSINLDWTRVYNIPLIAEGYASNVEEEGTYAIYEIKGVTYSLINYFTVPNSATNRRLGTKLRFVQPSADSYKLYIHAEGDGTEANQGRIYFVNKNSTDDWALSVQKNYRGNFRVSATYFENEFVRFGETVYKANTNLVPGPFNVAQWTAQTGGLDLLGYVPNDTNFSIVESTLEQNNLEAFGSDFDVSDNGEVLISNSMYTSVYEIESGNEVLGLDSSIANRKVVVYRLNSASYEYSQILEPFIETEDYGYSIAVSADGKKIAVGAPDNSEVISNGGAVYIYIQDGNSFKFNQTIRPVTVQPNTQFGYKLDFDGNTLAVTSRGGDIVTATTFDTNTTTLDNNSTVFRITDQGSGVISIYETVNNTLLYSQDFAYDLDTQNFGNRMLVNSNHVYVGLPKQQVPNSSVLDKGLVAEFRKPAGTASWSITRRPVIPADVSKFKGVYLYRKKTNSLISYVDYIDPIQGKIAGPAEQELSFKTSYDPARYSNTTTASGITAYPLDYHSDDWIGRLWWDIDSAKFINHHQGDITESSANFNKLFPGTEVKVYEWVESELLPSEYDEESAAQTALEKGISGTTLYGDDAYSVRRKYDPASQTFTTYYYFWVLAKATLPPVDKRSLSCYDVIRLIEEPANIGYRFVAMLADNKFAIHNCESLIEDKDSTISFNWWTIENQEQPTHIQYQLISDGLETSVPNREIEQKWFDSLVGFDTNDRPVPDIDLPIKEKYGALNEPRQSWFVNRTEARKQFIERANKNVAKHLIVDEFDLTPLNGFDPQPTLATGLYDTTADSYGEIGFVSVARVQPAQLTLEVENGVIINVLITNPGQGYINTPTYTISDNKGSGCELDITLNENGAISNVTIINGGRDYTTDVKINVRKFTVLVKSDETIGGKWSVYEWDGKEYLRTLTQSYDINLYWKYIDWYASGYNQFTFINHTIESSFQIYSLDDQIGDIVKINSVGTGGWLLLRKIANLDSQDYTLSYETIGRENGTIEFKNSLYDVNASNTAFDGASFDKIFYDTEPNTEFRLILGILKNNIFIDDLAIYWNELFFASLRYVFAEQPNVDWVFKTSFVKAKHNIGELKQKVTFQNDSLPSYQNYVEEMKPYKTKIREYLSSYEKIDPASNVMTDFDLAPFYDEQSGKILPQDIKVINGEISVGLSDVKRYPGKHWLDNVGFEIVAFSIADAGSGYQVPPRIVIEGGGGSGATADAFIGNGKVTNVIVTNPGSGYITRPTIKIIGSIDDGGSVARLSPILGRGKARSAHIRCKFDRVTGNYLFQTLSETETFTAEVDQQIFNLKWPMQLKTTQISVTVDGLESLRSEYIFDNIEDTSKGYTRNFGRIFFTNPLDKGKSVIITYNKAPELLQAQDRINLYYNPTTGMYGNDLGQLLDGIDYGGVEVSSFDFGTGTGWDSDSWFTTTYDTFDTTFEDEIFQIGDDSTRVLNFASPLEANAVYNVYKNGVRLDDPNFGTSDPVTNTAAVMQSITGAGQTGVALYDDAGALANDIIIFDEEVISTKPNDVLVFRKSTSDGAFLPDPRSYDTILRGGDFAFSTARGINPEEIIVDGDDFVSPTTSKGPEEQVPGQVLDSVNIRVFHRPQDGGSMLSSNSYRADGINDRYGFGIQPQNKDGLFVRLNDVILAQNLYKVDYRNKQVKFNTIPAVNADVNIISVSGNGKNSIEQSEFVGDGSTNAFVTKIHYSTDLDYYATVNGEAVDSVLTSTEDSAGQDPKAMIIFGSPPPDNSVINYAIYTSVDNFSKIETTEFTGDGSTKVFPLAKTPYSALPNSHNVIVKLDNQILNPGYNQQFDCKASQREYFLELWQSPVGSFDDSDILVLLNGKELTIAVEYNIRPSNSSIILEPGIGVEGDILEIYLRTDGDYAFGDLQIINSQNTWVDSGKNLQLKTAPTEGQKLTVYTFNKHDSMDFERQNFDVVARSVLSIGTEDHIQFNHIKAGLVKLRYPAIDAQYVWLTVNGILQTPSVDYKLTDDKNFVKYKGSFADDDVVEVIQFSSQGEIQPKFGFSQFKDILNRNIYKRLGDVAPLKLAKDLKTFDKEIFLDDASKLGQPDKNSSIPGIVFINGERIEFLIKQGNVLRQIQRGTLGTGVPSVHESGSDVYNQGPIQTAPYADQTIVEEQIGDGSTAVFPLSFTPTSVNEFEVFVAGKRLRKNAVQMFNPTLDQDSPEADETAPAEFSVDGTTASVTLLNTPALDVKIKIVRRQGKRWADPGITLNDAESLVARFFKAEKVELPK